MITSIIISIQQQRLVVYKNQKAQQSYMIASAKNGVGQIEGSECTPLGKHRISEKIGELSPENTVFIGRVVQVETYSEALALKHPDRDWILTRILCLQGMEEGYNSGLFAGDSKMQLSCDTQSRYIYIHGCPDSHPMQIPSSHGCIKMRNSDVIDLFDIVEVGDEVNIQLGAIEA